MPLPIMRDDKWLKTAVTMSTVKIRWGEKRKWRQCYWCCDVIFLLWRKWKLETGRTCSSSSSSRLGSRGWLSQRFLSWCNQFLLLLLEHRAASTPLPTHLFLQRSPCPRLYCPTGTQNIHLVGCGSTQPAADRNVSRHLSRVLTHTLICIELKWTLPLSMKNSSGEEKVQSVCKCICKFPEAPATFSSVSRWLSARKAKQCLNSSLCRSGWALWCQHN